MLRNTIRHPKTIVAIECYLNVAQRTCSAAHIAEYMHLMHWTEPSTTRHALRRLLRAGRIQQPRRGWYRSV